MGDASACLNHGRSLNHTTTFRTIPLLNSDYGGLPLLPFGCPPPVAVVVAIPLSVLVADGEAAITPAALVVVEVEAASTPAARGVL